ncbi:MAG: hypothetical protein RL275_357 [Chloroflexota bacterium]
MKDLVYMNRSGILHEKLDIWKTLSLIFLFVVSGVFLFYNAVRFELPMGFSGMFALMSEQISSNDFRLPESTPFYGPGGIPFAYPPLGFYVMAMVTRLLDVSSITYLRFVPPFFSLLALIPVFFLVERITRSFWAGVFSTLFVLFSPTLYYNHTWSAGMVRGLAFFLMFSGFYSFYRAHKEGNRFFAIMAGVFLGMTSMTHLFYGLFFALWIAGWWVFEFNKATWKNILFTGGSALLVSVPWLYVMITRYGFDIFTNAFSSHDNDAFLNASSGGQISNLFSWAFLKVIETPIPALGLILAGGAVIYLIYKRQYGLPAVLVLMVFFLSPESERFFVSLAGILIGVSFAGAKDVFKQRPVRWVVLAGIFIVIAQMAILGITEVRDSVIVLNRSAYDVANFVEENVPADGRYLFVVGQAEAEWFPYVIRREPFVSKWGSEWLGTYDDQRLLQNRISYCKETESLQCLVDIKLDVKSGDIIITKKNQKKLAYELETSVSCKRLAVLGIYTLWSADCLK